MKTSYEDMEPEYVQLERTEVKSASVEYTNVQDAFISPEDITLQNVEVFTADKWSDSTTLVSLPVEELETVSNTDPLAQCELVSEMFYTASSEVSLLSDLELTEKQVEEESGPEGGKSERKECIAGHVAAMRERFESMTRSNTPCPDLARSMSPSLDVFRNITPSPDLLG